MHAWTDGFIDGWMESFCLPPMGSSVRAPLRFPCLLSHEPRSLHPKTLPLRACESQVQQYMRAGREADSDIFYGEGALRV